MGWVDRLRFLQDFRSYLEAETEPERDVQPDHCSDSEVLPLLDRHGPVDQGALALAHRARSIAAAKAGSAAAGAGNMVRVMTAVRPVLASQ